MVLPTGLIPVFAFVLTVGISVPVALTAHLLSHKGAQPFHRGLQGAIFEAGLLYLVGTGVVWAMSGDGLNPELWEIPFIIVVVGVTALLILTVLPLMTGQRLIQRTRDVDSETALRCATYGWVVIMCVVFTIFVASEANLLAQEEPQICLFGFCGISIWAISTVLLEVVVAILGPGLVGLLFTAH